MDANWIEELKQSAAAEGGPLIATLATVRTINSGAVPEARSVVIREVTGDGVMTFTSDSRSDKEGQLSDEPRIVIVLWLPKTRTQFRVKGRAGLVATNEERLAAWKAMSDSARAVFSWPPPGEARQAADEFPKDVAADVDPPGSFDVWTIQPSAVDSLDLRKHPHLRQKWVLSDSRWTATLVNP